MNWRIVTPILGGLATLFGAFLLVRVFQRYAMGDIVASLGAISYAGLAAALALTLAAFLGFAVAEYLAVCYAAKRCLSFGRVLQITAASLGIGHSIGLAALSSGAIRYRMYGRRGISLLDVAKIVFFSGVTVALGIMTVSAVLIVLNSAMIAEIVGVSRSLVFAFGAVFVAATLAYPILCHFRRAPITLRRASIALPGPGLAAGQVAIGSTNAILVASTFYACVAPFTQAGYIPVVSLYVASDAAAVLSHVPGGWGVLEYVVLHFLGEPRLIAGIVVFRVIYYLAPLFAGLAIFLADESMNALTDPPRKTGRRASTAKG